MNDPDELIEPSEAISLLDEYRDRFALDEESFFYLFRTCSALPAHLGPFEIHPVVKGCSLTLFGKRCEFELRVINANDDRAVVSVIAQPLDDKTGRMRQIVFSGWADEPESWLSVIRTITRCEGLTLYMHDFPATLRDSWAEYLRVRDDRLGF
jgi:hypothetical protein